jgi:CHAT domain-containing protein
MRSLAIRQKFLKENNEWIAASYNDLGLVYSQIDNDKALEFYEKALVIYEKLHGKDHPKIAIAKANIGFIYTKMELYGDATNNFESALKTWEKIYLQPHPTKAFLLFSLGETYQKIGNAKAANGYFDRALTMYEQSYGKKHPDIASVLNAVGNVRLSENKYDEALNYFQRALQANVSNFNSDDLKVNPQLNSFYNGITLLYSLMNKAQALESRYYGKTIKIKDLELAVATLQVCDTLIDRLRQHITNESDKISLGVIANEVYANGVRMAYESGEVALKKKPWFALSFFFAEKSKSAVLLEAISDVNAKSFARIPDDLLQEERTLKAAIALTAQKLAQKPSEQEEKQLRETAFNLNRSYEAFTKSLEAKFPEYYNLKFNAASPSISELQSKMDDKTAVISYFIDDKINHLYIFIITRQNYKIIDRTISADFDKYITGLRNSLYFNDTQTYKRAAEKLSADLLPKKLPSSVTDLVILPTGRLSIVPFETLLLVKRKRETDAIAPSYLINKYSVRYEFSAALILQKTSAKQNQQGSILLCAPVTFQPKDHLNELPGTESEVKEISQLFSSRNFKNTIFLRQQADEKVAKSGTLKDYSYLHFATHGIVDETSPELSRIFLQSNSDSEDGNLFTGEIYNLELNANLVTLSACQTGLGKISKGEGVIGLSRALVYAGAKSIIVSFWSVADESTAQLMTEFYRQMLEQPGSNYSQNLRNAKLALMRTGKYKSPYYWAPFVLIGF